MYTRRLLLHVLLETPLHQLCYTEMRIIMINNSVITGVVAAKRDLAHIIKIIQEGTSKLTRTIKMYAQLKFRPLHGGCNNFQCVRKKLYRA